MKIEKTAYGKRITIPATSNNSEFVYDLRNVRTINRNNPHEQPLLNELERGERIAERRLVILLYSMENFFRTANNAKSYNQWEQHNRMDWNEYYHDQIRTLAEEVNNYSFEYAERSRHGWCL